jgi:hypothetical protein
MKSIELTKPVTTESLLAEFESRFNQTMDFSKFTREELEDTANKVRTKIHNITQNEHFGEELKNHDYQKSQSMLDILNQAIKERKQTNEILPAVGATVARGAGAIAKGVGSLARTGAQAAGSALGATAADKIIAPIRDKLAKGQVLAPDEKKTAAKLMSDKEDDLTEVPGAGILKRMGRSIGAKAAGALGMKGTQAGLQGKIQADKKAKQLYVQLRRYAGQTGSDPNALTVDELTSFLKRQGMKIDQLPKGPPGKVLNKDQTDAIIMKTINDTFKHQVPQEPEQTQKAEPTSQTSFTNQFKQVAANLKQISADPEMKKALINFLQQQPVTASAESVTEGIEEQSELILAAKDMMDKVTGYLEDLATMKTEGMLELADRIRDEMGAEKADAFMQKIQPALEQAEATLSTTRTELDNGVRILTGEEITQDPMGADDTMNMDDPDANLDDLEAPETDEFGASDAEAGGTEPEGREQRESKEVFEASNRVLGKLAGK